MRSFLLVAMIGLLATACGREASFQDCTIQCTAASDCPDGFSCAMGEGLCRTGQTTNACSTLLDAAIDTASGIDASRLDGGVDGGVDGGSTSCPAAFGSSKYLFVGTQMTWPLAEAHCKSLDSTPDIAPYTHLVVLSDSSELGQLAQLIVPPAEPWLGYTDRRFGTAGADPPDTSKFRWITYEPAPAVVVWDSGQPDDPTPSCAYRDSNGGIRDRGCNTSTRAFICECDSYQVNPDNL